MNVSVIIPAHNAADTLSETIESILKQTFRNWEAIIVDNGSTDGTMAIAARFAGKDHRIRMINEPRKGVSIARNTGIKAAGFDWLLFLDADDWILPQHLERMTNVLLSDPGLDAVHCAWARVTADGMRIGVHYWHESGSLFPAFTYTCAFCIHACVVRRSIVDSLGGFDTSLITCEDWDLWQRIARTGTRFGSINEVLALYRMRQMSASNNGFRLFADGLRVIERGHSADVRVPIPAPEHAAGMTATQLTARKLYFACWSAGLAIGRGEDARPMLYALNGMHDPGLDPDGVANCIFEAALLPVCQPPSEWPKLWLQSEQRIHEFLIAFEQQCMAPGLAYRSVSALQRLIFEHSAQSHPFTIGNTCLMRVEVTEPIHDIAVPEKVERINCNIILEGTSLGNIELPVCDTVLPRYILTDAIAERFAWQILANFFERSVYPHLNIIKEQDGFSVRRKTRCLTKIITHEDAVAFRKKLHEHIGWMVFLQEICGCYTWTNDCFYVAGWKVFLKVAGWRVFLQEFLKCKVFPLLYFIPMGKDGKHTAVNGCLSFDICDGFTDIKVSGNKLEILLTVGGIPIGAITIPVTRNGVRASELRLAILKASGYELCRIAVREGLLGRSLTDKPFSLRERLKAAKASFLRCADDSSILKECTDTKFTTEGHRLFNYLSYPKEACVILGRRLLHEIGTSASRRAALPFSASSELINAAQDADEPVMIVPSQNEQPKQIIYMPEMIYHQLQENHASFEKAHGSAPVHVDDLQSSKQRCFNDIFTEKTDPWNYTSPYEQAKYEQTLEILPRVKIRKALELACAEGHFTLQLASRVDLLIAADISQIAVERAAKRCKDIKNIRFQQLDMVRDPLPGFFELIICSEVLYCIGGHDTLKIVAHKLAEALQPGGYLLMAHAHVIIDDPDHTGFDWGVQFGVATINEVFMGIRSLRLVKEIRTPLYRIQLFQKRTSLQRLFSLAVPEIISVKYQPTPLEPEVAAYVRWRSGGHPHSSVVNNTVTHRLPILMYHRVAPTGFESTSRYRVPPEIFEAQLRYLREAGYHSIHLDDWLFSMERKMPLPGKAVVFTFDDGYLDFKTYAWPILRKYGFLATVFLVTDHIGKSNSWDSVYGEELPLLGWNDIRNLQKEGVDFGSHTASHPYLTSLSPKEIVREGSRSRAVLSCALGKTVKTFAYPYGDVDMVVQHLIGACGYTFGVSCRNDLCGFHDPLLALPRIEVLNSDGLQNFKLKLGVSLAHTHA